MGTGIDTITLGGGCFWCLDAVYAQVDGVVAVECGYSNGHVERPTYEQVCTGRSGHAEVVCVAWDRQRIDLPALLDIFFAIHDPTTPDRQGHDVGPQYRSGIYWHDAAQQATARAAIGRAQAAYGRPVVTELAPLANYWRAEDEHQRYFERHPGQGYCQVVIAPKLAALRRDFAARLRPPGTATAG
jgi:peptide-methionine (S)-S-oxide reductase